MRGLAYPPERKAAVLAKMLPPNNMPLGQLAREEGISVATLAKWRAEAPVFVKVVVGVRQGSCRGRSFSGCLFGWPGIGAFRVQPDRADGLPVAGLA